MMHSDRLNRRDILKTAGTAAAVAAAGAFPFGWVNSARADDAKPKKVLMYSRSQGFEHPCIQRKDPSRLSYGEQLMTDWGKDHGFEVTATKDGGVFTADNLKQYDLFLFFTQ